MAFEELRTIVITAIPKPRSRERFRTIAETTPQARPCHPRRHSCVTAHSHWIAWHEWRVVVELISVVIVHGTQVVLVDCFADGPSQAGACVLVCPKMNATIDTGVVEIVVNLLQHGVLQNDGGQRWIHQRDGVSAL